MPGSRRRLLEGRQGQGTGVEHRGRAQEQSTGSSSSALARKGPFCTVPEPGELSSAADGAQALPAVPVLEKSGEEADPVFSQELDQ